jgi:hypothetical protein
MNQVNGVKNNVTYMNETISFEVLTDDEKNVILKQYIKI